MYPKRVREKVGKVIDNLEALEKVDYETYCALNDYLLLNHILVLADMINNKKIGDELKNAIEKAIKKVII